MDNGFQQMKTNYPFDLKDVKSNDYGIYLRYKNGREEIIWESDLPF